MRQKLAKLMEKKGAGKAVEILTKMDIAREQCQVREGMPVHSCDKAGTSSQQVDLVMHRCETYYG